MSTAQAPTRTAQAVHPDTHPTANALHRGRRQYLSFKLGAEEYGIDILRVQEIRGYEAPSWIANSADFIKGVVNLRGVIVPIVNMRIRFGLSEVAYSSTTATIVLDIGGRSVGMVVDSVSEVIELAHSQLRAAPELSATIDCSCITGLGTLHSGQNGQSERMLILMDVEQLMRNPAMGLTEALH